MSDKKRRGRLLTRVNACKTLDEALATLRAEGCCGHGEEESMIKRLLDAFFGVNLLDPQNAISDPLPATCFGRPSPRSVQRHPEAREHRAGCDDLAAAGKFRTCSGCSTRHTPSCRSQE